MMTTERDFLLNHINQSSPPEEVGPHILRLFVFCVPVVKVTFTLAFQFQVQVGFALRSNPNLI